MDKADSAHAFLDDALGDADATEVARLLRTKTVSAREVCEAAIRRSELVQPTVNAISRTDFERALAAAAVPATGAFAGVPTFVKDNIDVAGLPTTQGSEAFLARPAAVDSPCVTQLRALGVTVLGKTRLPEFGFNATTEYAAAEPVRNPWNLAFSAGGSSGGAAALVAAGAVPLAHANDGGGSTRIPASACGLVGLKPTRGRLVADPLDTRLPVRITTQGVLTRTVRDTARFYAAAEEQWRNPGLPPVRAVEGPGRTRLRVGVVLESALPVSVDQDIQACVLAAAELLSSLGHRVEEAPTPGSPRLADDFSLYWAFLGFLASSTGRRAFGPDFDATRTDNLTRGLARACRRQLVRVPGMIRRLRRSARDYRRLFEQYDVLLSPVTTRTTPPLGYLSPTLSFEELFPRLQAYASFTPLHNAAGGPAVSLPLGATSTGLPIGCQVAADVGDDRTLLELAFELEQARPWPRLGGPPA